MSMKRLSISRSATNHSYHLPPVVNLACLYLEDCTSSVENLVEASFPMLKKLSIINSYRWYQRDIFAVHNAFQTGRMPKLEELNIQFGFLRGFGKQLAEILAHSSLRNVEFLGANLSLDDGSILLRSIQGGLLDHIFTLNLENNEDLGPLTNELKAACDLHQIHLEISPAQQKASTLPFGLDNFLPLLNPSPSREEAATGRSAPNIDIGALISNVAPVFLSGADTEQQKHPNRSFPRTEEAVANVLSSEAVGNVLSSVLQSLGPTQSANTTPVSQSTSGSAAREAPIDLGGMLTTFLQAVTSPEESDSSSESNEGTAQSKDYIEDDLD